MHGVEGFGGSLRAGRLNRHRFETLTEAREDFESRRMDYNERRPHFSLG